MSYSPFAPAVSTLTDGAGRFVFDRLREGQWLLRARGGRGETSGEARVRVFDDSMSAVTITVAEFSAGGRRAAVVRRGTRRGRAMTEGPRGSVRGRVVRARGGAPVVDAAVTAVRGPEPAPDIAPVTDALGRFALDGLAPGDWLLRAHGPDGETGEVTVRVTADSAASATIVVADGAAWGMSERDA